MNFRTLALALITAALAQISSPQSGSHNPWIGVWQGQLEGQPSLTVTLGNDAGELGGTVVFNVVSRDGGMPHVIGSDSHVLLHPQFEGTTLKFQVIRKSDLRQLHIAMRLTTEDKAQLQCSDCGDDAPLAELARVKW